MGHGMAHRYVDLPSARPCTSSCCSHGGVGSMTSPVLQVRTGGTGRLCIPLKDSPI